MLNEKVLYDIKQLQQQDKLREDWQHYIEEAVEHLSNPRLNYVNPRTINYIAIADTHLGMSRVEGETFTELQIQENIGQQIQLISEICKSTKIDFVVFLGDLVHDNYYANGEYHVRPKENRYKDMMWLRQQIETIPVPVMILNGNHDFAEINLSAYNSELRRQFFQRLTSQHNTEAVFEPITGYEGAWDWSNYYYQDFAHLKLRCINLEMLTGTADYSEHVYTWIKQILATTPSDWHIICFNHGTICDARCAWEKTYTGTKYQHSNPKITHILKAFFEDSPNRRITFHTGHVHSASLSYPWNYNFHSDSSADGPWSNNYSQSITTQSANPAGRQVDSAWYYGGAHAECFYVEEHGRDDPLNWDEPCFDIVSICPYPAYTTTQENATLPQRPGIDIKHIGVTPLSIECKIYKITSITKEGDQYFATIPSKDPVADTLYLIPGQATHPSMFKQSPYSYADLEGIYQLKLEGSGDKYKLEWWWTPGRLNWVKTGYWADICTAPITTHNGDGSVELNLCYIEKEGS